MTPDYSGALQDVNDFPSYGRTQFGDSPELADALGQLIVAGVKTATCSGLREYEAENEPLPTPGKRTIVLDGRKAPLCLIETTEMEIRNFCDVDAHFAYEEGEGDRSLESWRREHWNFFTRSLAHLGCKPTNEMPLVCERFRLVDTW